jgi:hypothetical protein
MRRIAERSLDGLGRIILTRRARIAGLIWEAVANYEEALANEENPVAALSGGMSYEELVADLFRTEEEDDAVIAAILKDDPEGEKGIPYEQVKAEGDNLLAELEAAALRRCAAKRNLAKYDR